MSTRPGRQLTLRFAGQAALLCGLAALAAAQTITIKSITFIAVPPGAAFFPTAINSSGDVAGTLYFSLFGPDRHAAVYSHGVIRDLGTLAGPSALSDAYAINDAGQVAGVSDTSQGRSPDAFLYTGGVMHDLGDLGYSPSVANGLNASAQVVGAAAVSPYNVHAFLYSAGVMHDLGALGSYSSAKAINDAGDVVGMTYTLPACGYAASCQHAFLYNNGTMRDLGTPRPGGESWACCINASGQITGTAAAPFNDPTPKYHHAFLYANGVMTDIGAATDGDTDPNGMNNLGQIVGTGDAPNDAFLYAFLYMPAGGIIDLNSLLPPNSGWDLLYGLAINDAGQIVGMGTYQGQSGGFLLTIGTGSSPFTTATISGPPGINGWYLGAVSVTLRATSPGSSVAATYFSVDGAVYQLYGGPFPVAGDGTHQVSYYSVDTAGSQETAVHQAIRIDAGNPVSHVAALPGTAPSPSFSVAWSGSDSVSGIANYTISVADNGGAFAPWISGTTATQATYNGATGHTYGFYSIAVDAAGNKELAKTSPEAVTTVPGRPVSHVAPLPPAAPGTTFTVQWSGSAPGVGIRDYTIYASDNGGTFAPWLSGTARTQAAYSGVCEHTYGFYSIATDNGGTQELAKTAAEATTRVPFNPVSHVLTLPPAVASPNFNLQWSGVNTCTPIATWDIYVSDNGGAFTVWKVRTSATQAYFSGVLGHAYGFYSLAFDNGGSAEAPKSSADAMTQTPAVMAADVNSDGRIDCSDVSIVKAAIGTRTGQAGFNARADLNADGVVDVRDLAVVTQKLTPGTSCP